MNIHHPNDLLCISVLWNTQSCRKQKWESAGEDKCARNKPTSFSVKVQWVFLLRVCDGAVKKEREQEREREREREKERDTSEVRRNAVLAHRKRTKLSWLLGPGTVERDGVSVRLPLGWCGVFVSCQHAQLGAELTSLTRESQAAEELCEAADFSFLFLTDCQQVQCAVPQAFPERSQRRAPNER